VEDVAGNPPRGAVIGITIDRISGRRIVETWTNFDVMGTMQQPGGTLSSGQETTY